MTSAADLLPWVSPVTGLLGVWLGARLAHTRTQRREDRKAIITNRATLVQLLELPVETASIRIDADRREKAELLLLEVGLSSSAVWSVLRVVESDDRDRDLTLVDDDQRTVNAALSQRRQAYTEAMRALGLYVDGRLGRRRAERRLRRAEGRHNTSRGRITKRTRQWAEDQAHRFSPPYEVLDGSSQKHYSERLSEDGSTH